MKLWSLLGGLGVLSLGGLLACSEPSSISASKGPVVVTIRGQAIVAEVAGTAEKKSRGLGYRDALAPDSGMLFPYAEARQYTFWMAGMRFDLDLIWIRGDRIVDITPRVRHIPPQLLSPNTPLPHYQPREPADLVLEVAPGTAEKHGWRVGDLVRIDPPLHPSTRTRLFATPLPKPR